MARRWTATSNRSYEPAEERQGVLATLALIGALVVLGIVLMAASPGAEDGEAGEGAGTADYSDGGAAESSTPDGSTLEESTSEDDNSGGGADEASVPDDLSFLCGGDIGTEEINLDAEVRDQAQEEVERYVLTVYGDPGADSAEYERSVEEIVVGECFWASPASGYVNSMEERARSGGKANAPSGVYDAPTFARELSHFEIDYALQGKDYESGVGYTKAVGTAVWVSEESNGDARGWQESITVGKSAATGGGWKVLSGQTIPPTVDLEYEHYLPIGVGS